MMPISFNVPDWFYVVFWIFISIIMILFNKTVIYSLSFPFPMFLTLWHMILATLLTQIMARTTNMLPGVASGKMNADTLRKSVLPIALFFAVSLVCSNRAYIYLSVSFIQMLKAFTPAAVLSFSFTVGIEKPSVTEFLIIAGICVGVAIASYGETQFSAVGFIFQVVGILAEASRLVLTGMLMKNIKLDPLSSLYYIAPICVALIGSVFLFFEASSVPWGRVFTPYFSGILLANGLVAFSLNVAVVLLINFNSALVLTLAGVVKDVMLVVLSMIIFGSPVTLLQYFGYGLALVGLNLHKEYKKNNEVVWEIVDYVMSALVALRPNSDSNAISISGELTDEDQFEFEKQELLAVASDNSASVKL